MFFLYIACTFTIAMAKKKIIKTVKKSEKKKSSNSMQKTVSNPEKKNITIAKPSKPEPKNKLVLEYIIYASQKLLFEFITTPSGLSEWFADNVNIQNNIYTFIWDGAKQEAE